ncbi:MAG: hypothetical protein HXY40_09745 [Chloroflexi bacterium]|nr:hypothetical protein [Chloroflexota bacterium]
MWRRYWALLLAVLLLALPLATLAQAPEQINLALADLGTRVGRTITLADLSDWAWSEQIFPDASLGCPQTGQTYAQVQTRGFQFILTFENVTYDYRVSADGTLVVLCSSVSAPESCDSAPGDIPFVEPRLTIGQQARVVQNITLSLRAEPTRGALSLADIPAGTVVDVLDGPRCAIGSLRYWQIRYNSPNGAIVGWGAEGYDGEYYLEPLTLTPGQPQTRVRLTAGNIAGLGELFTVGTQATSSALSPDSRFLALGDPSGTLTLYDLASGETGFAVVVTTAPITALAFTSDSSRVAGIAGGSIYVYNVETGTPTQFSALEADGTTPVTLNAMAFSPLRQGETPTTPGVLLLAGGSIDGRVWVWDFGNPTAPLINGVQAHNGVIVRLEFAANGTALITSGADSSVRIWGIPAASGGVG